MADDEYRESVGEYGSMKTSVGGSQPTRIKTDGAGNSEELASNIAKRTAGDPNAYTRDPGAGDTDGKKGGDGGKHGGGGIKVPLIISGIILAILGAVIAFTKQSKKVDEGED